MFVRRNYVGQGFILERLLNYLEQGTPAGTGTLLIMDASCHV